MSIQSNEPQRLMPASTNQTQQVKAMSGQVVRPTRDSNNVTPITAPANAAVRIPFGQNVTVRKVIVQNASSSAITVELSDRDATPGAISVPANTIAPMTFDVSVDSISIYNNSATPQAVNQLYAGSINVLGVL